MGETRGERLDRDVRYLFLRFLPSVGQRRVRQAADVLRSMDDTFDAAALDSWGTTGPDEAAMPSPLLGLTPARHLRIPGGSEMRAARWHPHPLPYLTHRDVWDELGEAGFDGIGWISRTSSEAPHLGRWFTFGGEHESTVWFDELRKEARTLAHTQAELRKAKDRAWKVLAAPKLMFDAAASLRNDLLVLQDREKKALDQVDAWIHRLNRQP